MSQGLPTFIIIILLALGGWGSRWLVELPHYPVGRIHSYLVFLCGAMAVCCINISVSRKSVGFRALAGLLLGLGLALGLFSDLCFRWPDALLLGITLNQLVLYLVLGAAHTIRQTYIFCGLAATALLIPFLAAIYLPWPEASRSYIGGVSFLACGMLTFLTGRNQPRKITLLIFFIKTGLLALGAGLAALAVLSQYNTLSLRITMAETLFWFLLISSALFVAGMFETERVLRTAHQPELDVSMRDPLTGVANRRALDTHGPPLVHKSLNSGRPVSVLVCDIDHFKQINDIHGHQAGDATLRKIVEILTSQVRQSDLVTRYGGEEFVIILPGSPLAPAIRLAERMRQTVENERMSAGNHPFRITASFGIATAFPENPITLNDMIKIADANLYTAKRDGRNCVRADDISEDTY